MAKIKVGKRLCCECGESIATLAPMLLLYVPTQQGEDHIGSELVKRWCLGCVDPAELGEILKNVRQPREGGTPMLGKPTNVAQEDLSEYSVEIEAPEYVLPRLVQQFEQCGYDPEKIKGRAANMMNTISARRRLPNQRADEVRFTVGNYAHICRIFELPSLRPH